MASLSKGWCLANFYDLAEEVSVIEYWGQFRKGSGGFPSMNVMRESVNQ
jgi:hypothetical protein